VFVFGSGFEGCLLLSERSGQMLHLLHALLPLPTENVFI